MIHEPAVLIEGVLFRARYLGSTQLVSEGQPTKTTRMMQAEEAVSRIKVRLEVLRFLNQGKLQQVYSCILCEVVRFEIKVWYLGDECHHCLIIDEEIKVSSNVCGQTFQMNEQR